MTRTLPLLRDRHSHPLLYASMMDSIDLNQPGVSRESAIARVRERANAGRSFRAGAAAGAEAPAYTIATGWNSGRIRLDKTDFDGLPPVAIISLSLHGFIVNDAGRELMRTYDDTVAAHLDDQDWIERNLRRVLNVFANAGASVDRLRRFFEGLRSIGVHHAEEMLLVSEREIQLFDEAGLANRTRFWAAPETYDSASSVNRDRIHGIKLFTDGALGMTTAALHTRYRSADHCGILLYSDRELEHLIARYSPEKPMAIHAIGDAAIDQVVTALEAVSPDPSSRQTIRMEHAQLISPGTAHRAKAVGLHLSMQPNFNEDSVNYADRLPDGYPPRNNPFRMLIDDVGYTPGVDMHFGSDGMPHGAAEAIRQSLFPDGRYDGQVLRLDELVAGYCMPDASTGAMDVVINEERRSVECHVRSGP